VKYWRKGSISTCNELLLIIIFYNAEPTKEHLIQFVIPKIKALWEDATCVLLYGIEEVEGIKAQPQNDVKSCSKRLFVDWLSTSKGAHLKTWATLLKKLKTSEELTKAADDIEKKLQNSAEYK